MKLRNCKQMILIRLYTTNPWFNYRADFLFFSHYAKYTKELMILKNHSSFVSIDANSFTDAAKIFVLTTARININIIKNGLLSAASFSQHALDVLPKWQLNNATAFLQPTMNGHLFVHSEQMKKSKSDPMRRTRSHDNLRSVLKLKKHFVYQYNNNSHRGPDHSHISSQRFTWRDMLVIPTAKTCN